MYQKVENVLTLNLKRIEGKITPHCKFQVRCGNFYILLIPLRHSRHKQHYNCYNVICMSRHKKSCISHSFHVKWVNYHFLVSMASFEDSNCFPIIISLKNT